MSTQTKSTSYKFKFVGRKTELGIFNDLLTDESPRKALYIEAEGGIGKTKLLNEFIDICKNKGWNLGPENKAEELLIDFYALENRTIPGLRHNIIVRIGERFFPDYIAKDKELKKSPVTGELDGREGRIAALSLEMRSIFLRELMALTTKKIKPTALFFDTFELVYNREVGRWFLQEFIPAAEEVGIIIVFVGRKREFDIPGNVRKHELKRFEKTQEYSEYFKSVLAENDERLYELSSGKPLLVELMWFLEWDDFRDELFVNKAKFEILLIRRFIDNERDNPFFDVILEMSYLKRGFTERIFKHRQGHYTGIDDWTRLKKELIDYPFVKYYQASDTLVLHDEFQRMMEEHGGGKFIDKAFELYNDVVKGFYEELIVSANEDSLRNLLRVEQLAYILNL